jgi:hypothetical protein
MHRLIYFVILLSIIRFGLSSDTDLFNGEYHFDTDSISSLPLTTEAIIESIVEDNVTESSLITTTIINEKQFLTEVNLSRFVIN